METLLQDLRYSARKLFKSPGFTAVALITLALGIGANTAIFSVIDAVLLDPLPYDEPDRLVMVWGDHVQIGREAASLPDFTDWREQARSFEGMAAYTSGELSLTGEGGDPVRLSAARVTHGFFRVFRTEPAAGRAFLPDEDRPGGPRVVVLSHRLWGQRFGGDAGIVGRTITLDGEPYTVVGVAAAGFARPSWADVWVPLAMDPASAGRRSDFLGVFARLEPGVSIERAQTEMEGIMARLEERYPETNTGWSADVVSLHEQVVGDVRPALLVLLGAVAFVLLIACVNIANLLLARAATREHEISIRAALGAGRGRLVRQLLTESALLAMVGAGLGLALAYAGVETLLALAPGDIPRLDRAGIDLRVLLFTLGLAVLTGVLFGLAPAFRLAGTRAAGALREREGTGGRGRRRLDGALVVAEVALAIVLLASAGLVLRSVQRLNRVDPGFAAHGLLTFDLSLPSARYGEPARRITFARELTGRLEALPGARAAGIATELPMAGGGRYLAFAIDGAPPAAPDEVRDAQVHVVGADFFRALGIPLLRGRTFEPTDDAGTPNVVVVNRALAERYWPDANPLGRRISFSGPDGPWRTVVGVVGNVRYRGLDTESYPQMYGPYAQVPQRGLNVVVRTGADPLALAAAVRDVVRTLDPELPVAGLRTMESIVSASIARPRFNALLLGLFAGLALVLALVGIYGVIAYAVMRRTNEIGIRVALGAAMRDVYRDVIGHGMALVGGGIVLGLVGAALATRALRGMLFGVGPADPPTLFAVAVVVAATGLLASWVPARRAARVDPMTALRRE